MIVETLRSEKRVMIFGIRKSHALFICTKISMAIFAMQFLVRHVVQKQISPVTHFVPLIHDYIIGQTNPFA